MRHGARARRAEAGYILAIVTLLAFALAFIGFAFISMGGHETRASQKQLDSQRAFWLAEAAKDRALRWMTRLHRPPEEDLPIFEGASGPDGGFYSVQCRVDTSAAYSSQKAFVLDCVGDSRGIQRRIRQWIRMTSFASYAYFTDDEMTPGGDPIWYVSADVIEGRWHSNGTLRASGTPSFLGRVTSASDHMIGYPNYWIDDPEDWPVGGNDPLFAEGAELNVEPIPLPSGTLDLRLEALSGGVYVAPEAELELGVMGEDAGVAAPGWLRYRTLVPPGQPWTSVRVADISSGVFYCNNTLHLKGVLDGELTIASHQDIRIDDNLTYFASDAHGAPLAGCNDMLGLVAERNIIFSNNAPNQSDLTIHAVLMALNTSITAEQYNQGSPRGILTIWGGLIQKYRGPVGTFSGGAIVTGYRKAYHYDTRVTARTPPAFPLTGTYDEIAWQETWDESDPF